MAASFVNIALGGVVGGGGGGVLGGPLFRFGEDGTGIRLRLCKSRCKQRFSSSSFLFQEQVFELVPHTPLCTFAPIYSPDVIFKGGNALQKSLVRGVGLKRRIRDFVLALLDLSVATSKLVF
jgi:hypothetical protein